MTTHNNESEPRRPKIGHHKPTNRARFKWRGAHCYVGAWDTKHDKPTDKALEEFARQWQQICDGTQPKWPSAKADRSTSIAEMVLTYVKHLEETGRYQRPDGTEKTEMRNIKVALGRLVAAYGTVPTAEFGSAYLLELQKKLVKPMRKVKSDRTAA